MNETQQKLIMGVLDDPQTKSCRTKVTISQRISQFQKQHSNMAYVYATMSNVFFVVLQINLKTISNYINPLHALAIRGFFLLLLNSIVLHYSNMSMNLQQPSIFHLMIKRIFLTALTVSMFLAPLKYVPAGTANSLFNTAPIIVCFVEAIKYKKPLSSKHLALTVISFIGIILVIHPDFLFGQSTSNYDRYKFYLLFSLAAAFTNSISMTYLHDLKGKVSSSIALHYFYIGQCLFNSVAMMFQEQKMDGFGLDIQFYFSVLSLVMTSFIVQNCMTRAIMLKKPSYIMPLGYVTIILSSVVDYVVFGTTFTTLSIIGMFLTSCGLLIKLLVPEDDKQEQN